VNTKILSVFAALALSGCVTIPVPPFGEQRGQMGDIFIKVDVSYIPKSSPERNPNSSELYAWEKFKLSKPKLLKDK
jgi:hypothetical protein